MKERLRPWIASVVLHAAFVGGSLALAAWLAPAPDEPRPIEIAFFDREAPPPPEREVEPRPEPKSEPKPEPRPQPPPAMEPEPVLVAQAPAETPRPATAPVRREPPRSRPPVPTAPAPAPRPQRRVQVAGFAADTPASAPAPRPERRASRGAFAQNPAASDTAPRARTVSSSGFGATNAESTGRTPGRVAPAVNRGGFDAGAEEGGGGSRAAPERRAPKKTVDTPVSIVSKPKPVYTDEARRLRIEGEVVLQVTFVADGRLKVLRVVDGLGHGLDEAAIAAAKNIEFEPARRHGRPVDHTAHLRVVFKLA